MKFILTQVSNFSFYINFYCEHNENFYGYLLVPVDNSKGLNRVFIPSILYFTLQHFFYSFNQCIQKTCSSFTENIFVFV